ncbi:calcium-binding protein [Novosphingobium sp. 1949]|uniref:Calcium-binding protein n=1 Tax=Novosphingobium organovorum TaxID=2930092 RepID=A0ABT0BCW8_9SPHN|nr:calcium-binding protein [Novosphingobium organovorum]MCJ2182867.1 calcium-binding protein [Novosphingobium organovorum]
MADFVGTNGDDAFAGTSDDDTFTFTSATAGSDYVSGDAGNDALVVDYGASTGYGYGYLYTDGAGGWSGSLSDGENGWLSFYSIEQLTYTMSDGDGYFYFNAWPLSVSGQSLTLDGGAGIDTLAADFSGLSDVSFVVSGSGVASNFGSYANWEAYTIWLGGGANTVVTGAGNDTVYSNGGTDSIATGDGDDSITTYLGTQTIDAGSGSDTWRLEEGAGTEGRAHVFSALGSSSGATTVAGIEYAQVWGGSGDDSYSVDGTLDYVSIYDLGGADSLLIDLSASDAANTWNYVYSWDETSFYGGLDKVWYAGIEDLTILLGTGDDYIYVDAAPLANGASLSLDGGAGSDSLAVNFGALTSVSFVVGAGGAIASNLGSYTGFEVFDITLGGGTNSVTTADGNDVVRSTGGTDTIATGAGDDTIATTLGTQTIDAGSGTDTWNADESAGTVGRAHVFSALGSSSGATTVAGIEYAYVTGGSGDDSYSVDGTLGYTSIYDAGGTDSLSVDLSASDTANTWNYVYSGDDLSFYGSVETVWYSGIEDLSIQLGSGNDYLFLDATPLANGASLSLDGGAGSDSLTLDLTRLSAASFIVAGDGTISSDIGSYAGFEQFNVMLGDGTYAVRTGDGDDYITTHLGTQTIDAGSGTDTWNADESAGTVGRAHVFSALGSSSGASTVAGIEYAYVTGGSGDDSYSVDSTLGYASIYDVGGTDSLSIDLSASDTANTWTYVYSGDGLSFYGGLATVWFSGIEDLSIQLGSGNDYFFVDATPLANGGALSLDGGAGEDTLAISFGALPDVTFVVGTGGAIASNTGSYAGFEAFDITLGGGTNSVTTADGNDVVRSTGGTDTIATGAGDDTITTTLGTQAIDAGSGTDTWNADESAGTVGRAHVFSALGSSSGASTVAGIEYAYVTGGSGDDSYSVDSTLGYASIYDVGGTDSLSIDLSASDTANTWTYVYSGDGLSFYGGLATVWFSGIEDLSIQLGSGNDYFFVDATPLANGGALSLDGGAGEDTLAISFGALPDVTFVVGTGGAIASNTGSYAGFEAFDITLGGGTNSVTTADGNDVVRSTGGTDTIATGAGDDTITTTLGTQAIDAGSGTDTWRSDESAGTVGRSHVLSALGSSSGATTAVNVETVDMTGGTGDDSYSVDGTLDYAYINDWGGRDSVTIDLSASSQDTWNYIYNWDGTAFYGGVGNTNFYAMEEVTLRFGSGNDYLYADTTALAGGATLTLDGGEGSDTLSLWSYSYDWLIGEDGLGGYVLTSADGTQSLSVTAFETVQFIDTTLDLPSYATSVGGTFLGTAGDDVLVGTAFDDLFQGYAGNDVLTGGAGTDTASYAEATKGVKVDLALTISQNTGGAGRDTLTGIENLIGSAFGDKLSGNDLANVLTGGAGADTLDGRGGADTLIGGDGNDKYYVDDAGDLVIETGAADTSDTVYASISYALTDGVEKLYLTGSDALDGTGNALANTIYGNDGANTLSGLGGADKLYGYGGDDHLIGGDDNDKLDGGLGADVMEGGGGNDKYYVDDLGDVVIEDDPDGGTDSVYASVSFALGDNLEKLILQGTGAIDATGNAGKNTLTGNSADNVLNGSWGKDVLKGGLGADTFVFDVLETSANKDTVGDFVSGTDTIQLSVSAFGALADYGLGALDPAELVYGNKALTAEDHLFYDSVKGVLYYDADGSGSEAAVAIASFSGKPLIEAGDIVLI